MNKMDFRIVDKDGITIPAIYVVKSTHYFNKGIDNQVTTKTYNNYREAKIYYDSLLNVDNKEIRVMCLLDAQSN
jgi:hypothetical protein